MKVGIIVFIVLAILASVVCFAPLLSVAYTVNLEYQTTETYYEDVPYEVTETYYELEPVEIVDIQAQIKAQMDAAWKEMYYDYMRWHPENYVIEAHGKYETAYVTLRNIHSVAATFTVVFGFQVTTLKYHFYDGSPYIETHHSEAEKSIYLEPGEEGKVKASAKYYEENSTMTWSYVIEVETEEPENGSQSSQSPPMKTVMQMVEHQRTVTKYRQVEKERLVTTYRTETRYKKVTILDYLLHYK